MLLGRVVVHDQVQLLGRKGTGHVSQERQELLVAVPWLQIPVTSPVVISRAANKVPCRTWS
jgi:hypothetical protein